jgi:hypothetical protein
MTECELCGREGSTLRVRIIGVDHGVHIDRKVEICESCRHTLLPHTGKTGGYYSLRCRRCLKALHLEGGRLVKHEH